MHSQHFHILEYGKQIGSVDLSIEGDLPKELKVSKMKLIQSDGGVLLRLVTEEDETEVVAGTLVCDACPERYPIVDTIPNLLPPDLRGQD